MDEVIGDSPAITKLREKIPVFANQSIPLVIIGEAGVGKSLFAVQIHAQSTNNKVPSTKYEEPFHFLNFRLLSDRNQRIGLLGGAPPDLTTTRRSILEIPTTVILKHIDHANHFLQDQLTEALDSMQIFRPGSNEYHQIKCRIIFTFRKPISQLAQSGKLSPLICSQLSAYKQIHIPPLRERSEDISPIAEFYLRKFYGPRLGDLKYHRGLDKQGNIEDDLQTFLAQQSWKENVRGLIAFLRSVVTLPYEEEYHYAERGEVSKMISMLEGIYEFSLPESLTRIESAIINRALELYNGNQTKSSKSLGITSRDIRRKKSI